MKPFKLLGLLILIGAVGGGAYYLGTLSGHDHGATNAASTGKPKTLYTCGMHPQVIQDHPGNCPICSMKLNPVRREPGAGSDSTAATGSGERKIKYWRAPMDPTYISDEPGKSPMGMDLVPVYEEEVKASTTISIDPVTTQNMGIRTAELTNGPLTRTIRTVATIEPNETTLADVTTKFMGWAEKLHVDSTGEHVHKGDPLFEIYSPELYSAEIEYLLAVKTVLSAPGHADELLQTARTKLSFWDISDAQINELERRGAPEKTLKILAPIDGFVLEKMVIEGQMVPPGKKLYRIADLGLVWVQAQIYEQDLPFIKLGQEALVSLTYLPDRQFRGRVTYIYPDVDPKTRTVQVRMEFHNPGYFLKPGMFASVELTSELEPSALLVPDMAVLRSGGKNTVFVAIDDGKFAPRDVHLGVRGEDDMIQVLSGLEPGERVVTSGQFLLDSESQLREAIQKMLEPRAADPGSDDAPGTNAEPAVASRPHPMDMPPELAVTGATTFLCPMPEHVSIEYDHAGNCPICGMSLVPVSSDLLKKITPGGAVDYYTCPMPEHANIHLKEPGKCPECGMTLIPIMKTPTPVPTEAADILPSSEQGVDGLAPATIALPQLYTCPMEIHADVVSDHPGDCPKCGMKLVKTGTVEHGKIAEKHWREEHHDEQTGPAPEEHGH